MRGTMRRLIVWSLLAATMAFAVAACGSDDNNSSSSSSTPATSTSAAAPAQPGKGKPPVTIGTKDFTEEFILGELYKGALEAKGYTVNLKKNIGATEIIDIRSQLRQAAEMIAMPMRDDQMIDLLHPRVFHCR